MILDASFYPTGLLHALSNYTLLGSKPVDYPVSVLLELTFPQVDTPVCDTEIAALRERIGGLVGRGVLLGIQTPDTLNEISAWLTKNGLSNYGLLYQSAAWRSREVRGVTILDTNGQVVYLAIQDSLVSRNLDEIIRVIDAHATGEMCSHGTSTPIANESQRIKESFERK